MKWRERNHEQKVTITLSGLAGIFIILAIGITLYTHHIDNRDRLRKVTQAPPTPVYDSKHIPSVGKTLLVVNETMGSTTTKTFTAPKYWNVYWYYQCDESITNNFKIVPVGIGRSSHNILKVITGPGGSAYGNEQYTTAGTYKLEITSNPVCSWKMTVKTTA